MFLSRIHTMFDVYSRGLADAFTKPRGRPLVIEVLRVPAVDGGCMRNFWRPISPFALKACVYGVRVCSGQSFDTSAGRRKLFSDSFQMNTIPQATSLRLIPSPTCQNGQMSGLIFQENFRIMKQRLRGRADRVGEVEMYPERAMFRNSTG